MSLFLACLWLTTAGAQTSGDYTIGAGDTIDLVIHGHDLETAGLQVAADGTIQVPYVGQVKVLGMTQRAAAAHLRKVLADGYFVDPEVSVRVKTFTSQQVELFGAVKVPGLIPLKGDITLRALLAKAGGIQTERSTGFIYVTRGTERLAFRVSELQGPKGDFILRGGDVVDAAIGNTIFLAGEVANPGSVPFNPGLTASQAYLMAGGNTQFSRLSGAYIVRGEERIQLNLRRILKGKEADVELKPGDRMVVPVSPI